MSTIRTTSRVFWDASVKDAYPMEATRSPWSNPRTRWNPSRIAHIIGCADTELLSLYFGCRRG